MRPSFPLQLIIVTVVWICCALVPALAQSPPNLSGTWKTTYNSWQVTHSGDRVSGKYESDDGRIIGNLSGNVLDGFWIEKGSDRKCEAAKDGSYYWGRVTFTFDATFQTFTGGWTYCDADGSQGGWNGERISKEGVTEACDAVQLQRDAERMTREVTRAHDLLDGHEGKYLLFYEGSQVKMEASFDKVYHEIPGAMPFSNTANATLSTMRIETNQYLRHMPEIKILKTPKFDSAVNIFLGVVDDLSGLLGGSAGVLQYAGTVGKWGEHLSKDANEKGYEYAKGLQVFTRLMQERRAVLDAYRADIQRYFCKSVVPLEAKIWEIRSRTIPESTCTTSEREALNGWFSRGTQMNNQTAIETALKSCETNW